MVQAGRRLGRFQVIDRLGSGGMGATFLAVWNGPYDVQQRVCIKQVNAEGRNVAGHEELFRREAALCASLRHPGIVGVLEVDLDGGFIVYEYIDGCDLRALMAGGRFPPPQAVHVLAQACLALEHAHRRRMGGESSAVIHRDISPSNLMVDRWGNTKVIDFGIGKAAGEASSGVVKGKLPYMSPEQAMAQELDGRSDQYSLGVVAYEMLAGVRPNDGADDRETHARILSGTHVPLGRRAPDVPAGLVDVVERMLAHDRAARFGTMAEVVDALVPFTPPLNVYRELAARVRSVSEPRTIGTEAGELAWVPAHGPRRDSQRPRPKRASPASAAGAGEGRWSSASPAKSPSGPPPPAGIDSVPPPASVGSMPPPRPGAPPASGASQAATRTHTPVPPGAADGEGAAGVSAGIIAASDAAPTGRGRSRVPRRLLVALAAAGAAALVGVGIAVSGRGSGDGPEVANAGPAPEQKPPEAAQGTRTVKPAASPDRPSAPPAVAAPGVDGSSAAPPSGRPKPVSLAGAPPEVAASSEVSASPRAQRPPSQATAGSPGPAAGRSPAGSPMPPEATQAAAPQGASDAPSASPAGRRGRLTVGVFPSGNVWINGRPRGAAPLTLQLRPGRYTIGVGTDRPTVKRVIRLRPGETNKLVIDLAKDNPSEAK